MARAAPHDQTDTVRPDSPILQAALDLALHGLPWAAAGNNGSGVCQCYVFPVSREKVPCTSSDKHPSERPRYGATRNQVKIRNNFREYPHANLGVETGVDFFVVDPDTIEGHPDLKPGAGLPALEELIAKMGGWPATRIAITPTGGRHYYWRVPPGITIGSRKFLDGVEIVGHGGVVVVPPSGAPIAKGSKVSGTYQWGNDLPIAEPPQWLVDRCKVDQQERFTSDSDDEHDPDKVCAALNAIRNDAQQGLDNNDWYKIGLAAYRGAGDDELVGIAFNNLSARRKDKYNLLNTRKRWKAYRRTRDGKVKVDTLYWYADQNDPHWRDRATEAAIASAFAPIPDSGLNGSGFKTNGAAPGNNDDPHADTSSPQEPSPDDDNSKSQGATSDPPPQQNKTGPQLFWHGEPTGRTLKPWAVKELIPETGTGLASGQWGACKTFTMLDLAGSIATGLPFAGREIIRTGGVLFIAAEGDTEIESRLQGLVNHKLASEAMAAGAKGKPVTADLDHLPFVWIEELPHLKDNQSFKQLLDLTRAVALG
jgi:Bifunctional DNA primase/polymerase, N-terminal/AAA domain/Primase C terminal 2 (PriCT-2)